ncbi:MAG: glycosyltransferase [Lachnospiraceae bacterium]|nr:glycosyltransferase [Lachnospiraceae bacterium]
MNVKYSVLMAVYEKEKPVYLRQSIESMLAQTIKPDEFIIVEDGLLTVELEKIVLEYEERFPKLFKIIRKNKNEGLAISLNIGLHVVKNELVARMDSDDISLPQRCERELEEFISDPDLDICGTQITEFEDDNPEKLGKSRIVPLTDKDINEFMQKRQPFNHPSVMYKKSSVLKFGGYSPLKRKEDFDLFSRMLISGCKAKNINEVLLLYRISADNTHRRKNWINTSAAIKVYWRHYRRGGCSFVQCIYICMAELLFYILPNRVVKHITYKYLRN